MPRQVRSTLVLLTGCSLWLCSALPAPAQGFGQQHGGKGPAHPGFGGGLPHRPGEGAGNRPSPFVPVQQQGGKTVNAGSGNFIPGNVGGNLGVINTGNTGNRIPRTTTPGNNSFRSAFNNPLSGNQPGLFNKIFGGPQPGTGPSIQSGVLVGPYGNINLVGRWWEPINSYTLLNSLTTQNNPLFFSSLGLTNPLFNSGFNSINYLGNSPFGLNNGLFGLNYPWSTGGFNSINYWGNNPLALGNTGWFGQYNPFAIGGFNSVNYWGNSGPFGISPLFQPYNTGFNTPLQPNPWGNLWNSPFTNPWANPALPGAGVNNPFVGFQLF